MLDIRDTTLADNNNDDAIDNNVSDNGDGTMGDDLDDDGDGTTGNDVDHDGDGAAYKYIYDDFDKRRATKSTTMATAQICCCR